MVTSILRAGGCCLLLFFTACSLSRPVAEQNLAHLYSGNSPFAADFSLVASPEEVHVFAKIGFQFPEFSAARPGFWEKYRIRYQLRPGFESSRMLQSDSIGPEMLVSGTGWNPVFQLSFPLAAADRMLLLQVSHRSGGGEYAYVCRIPGEESGGPGPFAVFSSSGKIPLTGGLARQGDTLAIRSFDFRKQSVKAFFSPFSQGVAMPPMAGIPLLDTLPDPEYPVEIQLNEPMIFRQPGYYILEDSTGKRGCGFAVAEGDFPAPATAAGLILPLVYISTREERKSLQQAADAKEALDAFWLKISPQKDRARELIRKYYQHIETANRHFTISKEGWKTDMGMVMAIFGPPFQVFKGRDSEIWVYDKGHGPENSVFYFFRKQAGNFADIWELKRLSDYDKVWYGVVDLWRKGLIDR